MKGYATRVREARQPGTGVCATKVGEPGQMRECRRPVIYLTAEASAAADRGPHSGWRHTDPADDVSHGAFPQHEL